MDMIKTIRQFIDWWAYSGKFRFREYQCQKNGGHDPVVFTTYAQCKKCLKIKHLNDTNPNLNY